MTSSKYAVQILYDNEWIWLTHPTYPNSPSERALSTYNTLNEAEKEANRWIGKFKKTRVVQLDDTY